MADVIILQTRPSLKVADVSGGSLDNGAPIIQWTQWAAGPHGPWGLPNQRFRQEHLGGDQYRLVAVHSGKVLDVSGGSLDNGAPIIQWDWHGGDNQRFFFDDVGGDLVRLRAVHSGKVLDVSGGSLDDGAPIIQWDWHGGNNQRWQIALPGD